MLLKMDRPSSTAATIVEKLSSASTMSLAPLATAVPDAHRHADIGSLERGRVVDAVARHRHHLAAVLQHPTSCSLCVGSVREKRHADVRRPSAPRCPSGRTRGQ